MDDFDIQVIARSAGTFEEPVKGLLVCCNLPESPWQKDRGRIYEITRDPATPYAVDGAAGQVQWLKEGLMAPGHWVGPLDDKREWVITEERCFIGRFRDWDHVLKFLHNDMRIQDVDVEVMT